MAGLRAAARCQTTRTSPEIGSLDGFAPPFDATADAQTFVFWAGLAQMRAFVIGIGVSAMESRTLTIVSVLISFVASVAAVWAGYIAWQAQESGQSLARANAYLSLRGHFFDHVLNIVPEKYIGDPDVAAPAEGTEDRRKLETYWYSTFDEWYVTRIFPTGNLWFCGTTCTSVFWRMY